MASKKLLTLEEVNALPSADFKMLFSNVIEHCPEAAQEVEQQRPFSTIDAFRRAFRNYIDSLDDIGKEMILKKHPDLAGRISKAQLTDESRNEQKLAGINTIDQENKRQFENLNKIYELTFSFPFIICARENSATSIMTAIQIRLLNDRMTELHNAIEEVKKICRIRLNDLVP